MAELFIPTEEHILALSSNLREEEVAEVLASHGHTPEEAVRNAVAQSDETWAFMSGNDLLAINGVASYSLLSDTASPWLLNTVHSVKHPREIMKYTKIFLADWRKRWRVLENYVDARYDASLRWAKWAGFTVYDAEPFGPYQLPFHRIEIRSE